MSNLEKLKTKADKALLTALTLFVIAMISGGFGLTFFAILSGSLSVIWFFIFHGITGEVVRELKK